MKKLSILVLVVMVIISCKEKKNTPAGTGLMHIPEGFPPMPVPAENDFSYIRWELGKKLFYEKRLSSDGSISCGSCHNPQLAFADNRDFSPGVMGRAGTRNAPSLANIGYHPYYLSEGGVPTLEMQVLVPVEEENEFAHDLRVIAKELRTLENYQELSRDAYARNLDPFVITRALATFQRSLISGNSFYDRYKRGESSALTESQRRGMEIFFSKNTNCSACHSGFNFTGYSFQNNGLYTHYADIGRKRLTGKNSDESLFKVPSLRNVEFTAPYMHDGSLLTLEEVIDHYNAGGKPHPNKSSLIRPLHLSETEKTDLLNFLYSLSDHEFISNPDFRP